MKSDKFRNRVRQSIMDVVGNFEKIEDSLHEVLEDFEPTSTEELKIVRGSVINVLQKETTGWWFAENKETYEFGWVPAGYLKGKH
jgi:hypothetical protein